MKKLTLIFLIPISMMFSQSIVGVWQTKNAGTGVSESWVRIYKKTDGEYYGKIIRLLVNPQDSLCDQCKGELKNKKVVGMEILKNLKLISGNKYDDGNIVDPNNGNKYSCKAEISKDGKTLYARGYLGISLLGRTETWIRVSDALAKPYIK